MHECTDIVAGRQEDDLKFSLLCAHLLSTLQDAVHRILLCFEVTAALLF
jgi:hypothetical protein